MEKLFKIHNIIYKYGSVQELRRSFGHVKTAVPSAVEPKGEQANKLDRRQTCLLKGFHFTAYHINPSKLYMAHSLSQKCILQRQNGCHSLCLERLAWKVGLNHKFVTPGSVVLGWR